MRTQNEIKDRLLEIATSPELDPLRFKREELLKFASYKTLELISDVYCTNGNVAVHEKSWKPVDMSRQSVVTRLRAMLKVAYNCSLMKSMTSVERSMQKIEMVLWILEDKKAIDFLNSPENFRAYGLPVIQYLDNRYGL